MVPVSDLTPEETTALRDLGLDLANTERVVTDIKTRMEQDNVDANTANNMAIDEEAENDRLSTVHPDVAAAIRESMSESLVKNRSELQESLADIDEDSDDAPKPVENKPTPPADDTTNLYAEMLKEQAKRYDQRLDMIRSKIQDEDRTALLNEVIRKIPFAKTFSFWQGKIVIVLSTISTKRRLQLQRIIAKTVDANGPLTSAQYDAYARMYDACCSLQLLTVDGQVVYVRDDTSGIDALIKSVLTDGPLDSEWLRNLVVSSYRDFRDFLTVLTQEASRDVFIDPVQGGTGSTL